jgi:ankyrin repeat protein
MTKNNMTEQDFPFLAYQNDLEGIRKGLAEGIPVDTVGNDGLTALCWAASGGYILLTQFLIDNGANVNYQEPEEGESVLMFAVQQDDSDKRSGVLQLLINNGAIINLADLMGWTALHHAAASKVVTAAEILLKNGADPNFKADDDRETKSPKDYAETEEIKTLFAKYSR